MEAFAAILGVIADLIGISVFLFALWVVWRAHRRWRRLPAAGEGAKPVALAIGINGSIEGAVERYWAGQQQPIPVRACNRQQFIHGRQYYEVLRELHEQKLKMTEEGVTELHLFYKGPIALAVGIGSIFDNWVPVHVYQLDQQTGQYQRQMVLGKGAVVGLLEDLVGEEERAVAERIVR